MSGTYIDATTGTGGHSQYILEHTDAKLICFDADPDAFQIAKERLGKYIERVRFYNKNFVHIPEIIEENVDGVLFDLGLSSYLVNQSERGFSYRLNGPLDMRYGKTGRTAEDTIKFLDKYALSKILFDYGGVRYSKRIANVIKEKLPKTTSELAYIVRRSTGKQGKKAVMKVFQALRIYVNNEYEILKETLNNMLDIVKKSGRIVVISYHSGEGKIIMKFFRENRERLNLLTKKVVKPTETEIRENRRSRSANLRAFEVI